MTAPDDRLADARATARLAVLAAAVAGDAGAAYHFLADLLGEGMPFEEILFDILAPLEAEVGRRWQQGDFCVSEEHVVTATLETVVSLLAGSFDISPDARRVVVACAEGDVHSLPARMVSAYLLFLGWRATFLGPGQPAADLGAYLREQPPEALVLSCAMATALPGARDSIREAHAAGVPVLAGGRGFGPNGGRAFALGADAWTADPAAVDEILRTWRPDPAAAEQSACNGGEDSNSLSRRRAAVVARALGHLLSERATGESAPVELQARLDLLVDALAASLLLDDPEVVVELAAWQRALPAAPSAGVPAAALLEALQAALEGDPPRAARFIAAAAG